MDMTHRGVTQIQNVCLYEKSMLKCNWENFLNFDGSFLLLSPDHHETVPRFVFSFSFLRLWSTPNSPLSVSPRALLCLPSSSVLSSYQPVIVLSFYWLIGWVLPFPVAKQTVCQRKALVCCQKILSKNMCMTFQWLYQATYCRKDACQ